MTIEKIDDPDSDVELNGDIVFAESDDKINNDNGDYIPREKLQPIKKTEKNKSSS